MDISAYASGSGGNLYRVSDGHTALLLEAGLSLKETRRHLDFSLSSIAACLITHEHMDHAQGAKDLMRAGVDVYATRGTSQSLGLSGHRLHPLVPRQTQRIGTWTVLPFPVEHDSAEPVGFLMASGSEKLLYLTDSYFIRYRFDGLTAIMLEANYALDILDANVAGGMIAREHRDRVRKSHMSLEAAKDVLRSNDLSRVEQIWLLHLSRDNADGDRFKREIQELTGRPVYVAPAKMGGRNRANA